MSTLFSLKPTKISKEITSCRTTCNFQSTKNRPIDHYSLHLPPGPHGVQTKSFVSRPQVTNMKPLSIFKRQPLFICSITRTFQAKLYEKELSLKKIIILTKNVLCKKKGLRACSPVLRRSQRAREGALRYSSHTQCTRLMMIFIYYDEVCVCLSVTKNHHFLSG